jgi:trehalose synthase-fused probable maltokinase
VIDPTQLAKLLPSRRWFGAKDRAITGVRIWDEATIEAARSDLVIALAAVDLGDQAVDWYHVLLLVDSDGRVRDAFEDVERLRVLGRLMGQGETMKGAYGMFHFGGPGLDPRSPPGTDSIRAVGAEQSNSSIVLDEDVVLKLFRRVEPGPNPELELTRLLTSEGFENIPAHVGEILYEGEIDGVDVEIDLGVAQQLIDGREGWAEMLDALDELYASADEVEDIALAVEDRARGSLDALARLGDVTASLHVVLAREELEPDVSSESVEVGDLKEWAQAMRSSLRRLLDTGLAELRPYETPITSIIDRLARVEDPGRKTRIHGDYHLGQVLLATRGWMILDLEGEPARSLEERRAKQSPLRDVAGMLRSFSYAASVALFARADPSAEDWQRLRPWADAWEQAARQRFLGAYLATSHEGWFLPTDRNALFALLDAFEIEKALYELRYERAHRPDWLRIPLRGISQTLGEAGKR